jgi:hypothetical protein
MDGLVVFTVLFITLLLKKIVSIDPAPAATRGWRFNSFFNRPRSSGRPEQCQDDDDQQHQSQRAAGEIPPVMAVWPGRQTAQKQQDQQNHYKHLHDDLRLKIVSPKAKKKPT